MKKFGLLLTCLLFCSAMALADNGPFHYIPITNSATSVTTTASAWTLLTSSKVDAKKVMIAEDTRSLNLKIAFSVGDTTNSTYWLQTTTDGIFDQPFKVNPAFGVMVGTTLTAGTGTKPTVRMFLNN